jgi:hypothetical protein
MLSVRNTMASESEFYEKIGRVTELAQYLEFDLGHIILMTKAIEKKFYEAPKKMLKLT